MTSGVARSESSSSKSRAASALLDRVLTSALCGRTVPRDGRSEGDFVLRQGFDAVETGADEDDGPFPCGGAFTDVATHRSSITLGC